MAWKQSYGKQLPEVLEKEHAVVEGIGLPGHWNRMFGTRVITDYDLSTLDQITDLPGGESLGWCYQCGKCVGVCPVDIVGDYGPRKIHRDVQRGISLLDDPNLWLCTTCMNCLRVCPKAVDMIQIMPAARPVSWTNAIASPTRRYMAPTLGASRSYSSMVTSGRAPVRVLGSHTHRVQSQ